MGVSGSIRINALDASKLGAMEAHGKRLDHLGRKRQVNDTPPLVYDPHGQGLDLQKAHTAHIAGTRQNKGARNVALHSFVQFPTDLKIGVDVTEEDLLGHAVTFINEHHGGQAVFQGRLDRDEQGRHGVDVFFAPRYEKITAKGSEEWVSLTKFGKDVARSKFGAKKDNVFYQGQAWQDLWFEYLQNKMRLDWVKRGERKLGRDPDRLEPEVYKLEQDKLKIKANRLKLKEHRTALIEFRDNLGLEQKKLVADRETLAKAQRQIEIREITVSERERKLTEAHRGASRDMRFISSEITAERLLDVFPDENRLVLAPGVSDYPVRFAFNEHGPWLVQFAVKTLAVWKSFINSLGEANEVIKEHAKEAARQKMAADLEDDNDQDYWESPSI